MKTYRIVVISADTPETKELTHDLSRNRLYDVSHVDFPDMTFGKVNPNSADLAILNLEIFNSSKTSIISDCRELGYQFPFLVISRWIDQGVYSSISKLSKVVVLEKPYVQKDLWGLVSKMLEGREARQRFHRRFFTNQSAILEPFSGGKTVSGSMMNLSRGGAYFECDEGSLNRGDIMRFHVPLKDLGKNYNVSVKVVWTAEPMGPAGRAGAGLEFVKAGDVYRNLLSKI